MSRKFRSIEEFVAELRVRAERDSDNLLPVFGEVGSGKSTVATQLGWALSGGRLTVDDIHFGIVNFLANAPPPPGLETFELRQRRTGHGHRVVLGDELELGKRRAMFGLSLDVQEFLKDCRGLNLDMIVCFPDEEQIDRAIWSRVKFKVVVERRGLFHVYERQERQRFKRGGVVVPYHVWALVGSFVFEENSGPLWRAYKQKKIEHMGSLGGSYRDAAREASSGVDHAVAVEFFRADWKHKEPAG